MLPPRYSTPSHSSNWSVRTPSLPSGSRDCHGGPVLQGTWREATPMFRTRERFSDSAGSPGPNPQLLYRTPFRATTVAHGVNNRRLRMDSRIQAEGFAPCRSIGPLPTPPPASLVTRRRRLRSRGRSLGWRGLPPQLRIFLREGRIHSPQENSQLRRQTPPTEAAAP